MLPGDREAAEGLALFEAGDSTGALEALHAAIELGVSSVDCIEIYLALTASAGLVEQGVEAADRFLEDQRLDVAPDDEARLRTEVLRSTIVPEPDLDRQGVRLLATLQAAAAAGPGGWRFLDHPVLRRLILDHLLPSRAGLEVAEQLFYAPAETEWPVSALQQIETIGLAAAHDPALARAAERLLHAFGNPEAAYRIERQRRSRSSATLSPPRSPARRKGTSLKGLTVAVAGGHPSLRATIGTEIAGLGGETREIPSRFEAVRRNRDIAGTLQGADVAIAIIPQIAHSTTDQVKRAASRLEVPIVNVSSASVSSILAALTRWHTESKRDSSIGQT